MAAAHHLVAPPQHIEGGVLQQHAQLLGDEGAAGQDGHVLQQAPLAIPEAGDLGADHHEFAPDTVHDDGGQGLRLDLVGHHEQGMPGLDHLLHDGQYVLNGGDLPIGDEHVGIVQHGLHALLIGDHVGREIAPIELHALHDLAVGLHAGGVVQADDAVCRELFHGFGDDVADLPVVGGNVGDAGIVLPPPHGLGQTPYLLQRHGKALLHALPQEHGVGAGLHAADALLDQALGKDDGRRGPVAHQIVGPAGHGAHQLSAHVLEGIAEKDLLGDGHAVVGDQRRAEMTVQHHVPAAGAQGHPGHIGQLIHAPQQRVAGLCTEKNRFVQSIHLR